LTESSIFRNRGHILELADEVFMLIGKFDRELPLIMNGYALDSRELRRH